MGTLLQLDTFAAPDTVATRRDDGTLILTSRHALPDHQPTLAAAFARQADEHPDRPLAAQRDADDRWVSISYGEARVRADALAAELLELGLGPDRPLMILSGNSIDHLLVTLGAYAAGVPAMPVSVAYSLMSTDHRRIRAIAELTTPGLVFAEDATTFTPALDALAALVPRVAISRGRRPGAVALEELTRRTNITARRPALTPEMTAKLLFTSGSTGTPKAVINTHRMLCSNQAMLRRIWPFLAEEPPVLVDWLPWSHTFGANHNLNLVLCHGGTLYIDDGKPAPALFPRTIAALRDIAPTLYFNVPAGFALLAPALENDPEMARHFFSRLRFMFYAAAALPPAIARRMRALAERHADHEVPLTSSWGTTETAPAATSAHFRDPASGCIGVPLAATAIKLAPVAGRLEIRVRGPNVTPGYFRAPELTAAAFDGQGFYRSGDAVTLIDATDPNRGMMFAGRIAEDFKLQTGTWVIVGSLRVALLSEAGVLSDAVICGENGEYVAALAWVNQPEARRVVGTPDDLALDDGRLRSHLKHALDRLNAHAGSATRIERLLLLRDPPSLDAGEITDKGYINQGACLRCRAAEVVRLYAADPAPEVITASRR